ncbi:MAG TPA: restriction endonuclease subunit S [Bacteroidales bacterium]|nr:restriction endonuclease subunit S [Bacteroidales bacterium]HQP52826.1 restriction endonuclease subunit S [Bacteroidales bacterium]
MNNGTMENIKKEKKHSLPKGWEIKKLGEVCEVIVGQSPEGKFYNSEGKGMPFYQGKKEYGKKFIGKPTTWTTKITKEAEAGDILMSVRAPVGPVNFATQRICIGRGLSAIRAGNEINKEFLYNFLLMNENKIKGNEGAVFNSINKTQIENIPTPLPPLSEQRRIVSILDKCFSAIERSRNNAEQNLKNAKEIFESYLNKVFISSTDSKTKHKNWEEKKLGEIAEIEYGFTDKAKVKGDFRYIRITDIDNEGLLSDREKVYINSNVEAQNFILNNNDLLMARTGATFAKVLLYEEKEPSIFASYLIRIKFNIKVENKLYWYFSKSPNYWKQANSLSSGAAQPQFNGNALKQIVFTFPKSKDEQRQVVKELDTLRIETQKLESIYQKKILLLEELKKSILQKAFNGELIMDN